MEEAVTTRMPLIGDDAPAFKAGSTQGVINFPDDYKGKWVILFSHPADFTPGLYDRVHDVCHHAGGVQKAQCRVDRTLR